MKVFKKELRLAVHPASVGFLFLSAMVMIPNYPYYVIFFYSGLSVFFISLSGRENQDIDYSLLLPIQKADLVRGRFLLVIFLECIQASLTVPFIFLRQYLKIQPNAVGMEANAAFLGIGFLMLGVFHMIFFSVYYKNPIKVGKAFLLASVGIGIVMIAAETCAHVIPFFRDCLDTPDFPFGAEKSIVLMIGIAGYAGMTVASYRRALRKFTDFTRKKHTFI